MPPATPMSSESLLPSACPLLWFSRSLSLATVGLLSGMASRVRDARAPFVESNVKSIVVPKWCLARSPLATNLVNLHKANIAPDLLWSSYVNRNEVRSWPSTHPCSFRYATVSILMEQPLDIDLGLGVLTLIQRRYILTIELGVAKRVSEERVMASYGIQRAESTEPLLSG